jgi:hypothetical protein
MNLMGRKNYWFLSLIVDKKHAGKRKCKVAHLGLNMGQYFMSINSQRAKNEQLWASRGKNTIVEMVVGSSEASEKKCKLIQFVANFWLLKLGQPLTYFENMKDCFDILKVKNILHRHWSNSTS